jgi:hypothetical protein
MALAYFGGTARDVDRRGERQRSTGIFELKICSAYRETDVFVRTEDIEIRK